MRNQSSTPSDPEEIFVRALTVVAHMAEHKLDEEVTDFWIEALRPHGHAKAARSLSELAHSIRPGRMPSIRDVIEKMGCGEPDELEAASEVARRICQAITDFGWNNWEKARAFIGPVGEKIIGNGQGWLGVCNIPDEKTLTFRANLWRQQALALMHREKLGLLDSPPQFREVGGSSQNNQLLGEAQNPTTPPQETF